MNAVSLLVAGHETTTNLIGNGTHALLRHPDQLARWHADPSLTPSAVEELLRYDPMAQFISRVATHETEVGGHRFHPGDHVILSIGAANRDPERFPDPDRLDLGRNDGFHLTFAYGVHHCLGAALARLEGQVALGSLVGRFPHMRLLDHRCPLPGPPDDARPHRAPHRRQTALNTRRPQARPLIRGPAHQLQPEPPNTSQHSHNNWTTERGLVNRSRQTTTMWPPSSTSQRSRRTTASR